MSSTKIDIGGIVEDWARDYFRSKASRKERKLLDNNKVALTIDWKRVKIVHHPPTYDPKPPSVGSGILTNNVLFNTSFTNKTDKPQTYSFRTERTTRSSCTVDVEKSYTSGMELSVKLGTPCEILEANAGFKREITLINCESQTTEEELAWSVDSQIEVPGRHTAEAKMIILEEEYQGTFEVVTELSGRVRVVLTNMKDNNSLLSCCEDNICNIIKEKKAKLEVDVVSIQGRTLLCKTKGTCKFKYGIKQTVEVDQKPLNNI